MKYAVFTLVIFLFGCERKEERTAVTITSVDVNITTIVGIDCGSFFTSFDSTEFKTRDLKDKSLIGDLITELGSLEEENDKRGVDTRATIILINVTSTDTLCADRFTIRRRAKYYRMTDELREMIW